jgi:tRNA-modifying protein YgfZ
MAADDNRAMNTTLSSSSPPHGVLRLSEWGLIHAAGADTRPFLHGQLTNDVQKLAPGRARLAGYCSAKGRLLASFVIWPAADDGVWLACSADLLPPTLKRLSMFVLRAKCKLTDAAPERVLWGAAGPAADAWLGAEPSTPWQMVEHDAMAVIRLPDAMVDGAPVRRCLAALPVDTTPALLPETPELSADAWRALEVVSGVPRIVAATSEQFVPQMVNLELVGGVSFDKGCYPGQEIVARSQYRGTLKRRMFVLAGDAPMSAGQEVFNSDDPAQPVGLVVLAGRWDDGPWTALAELKLSARGSGSLHLGAADGPLMQVGALPYEIPSDTAAAA